MYPHFKKSHFLLQYEIFHRDAIHLFFVCMKMFLTAVIKDEHASCDGSVVVNLLFNIFLLFAGVLFVSLFCSALFCVHSSFAIILKRKRILVALLVKIVFQMYCYYTEQNF